jgi:hypothetical protein
LVSPKAQQLLDAMGFQESNAPQNGMGTKSRFQIIQVK